MQTINKTLAWQDLENHQKEISSLSLKELFAVDKQRFDNFSLSAAGLFLDYSKNHITTETIQLLLALPQQINLQEKITAMFAGEAINFTEQRAVLHTALRNETDKILLLDSKNVMLDIQTELNKLKLFSEKIRNSDWQGFTGKAIDTVVNIGIGGSYLGPKMLTEALQPYANHFATYFISNIDYDYLQLQLNKFNPETTLFILSSKSFSTIETLENGKAIKNWLFDKLGNIEALDKHLVAVTANENAALQFGVANDNIFKLWGWVGGRYSIWSAIALPVILTIGIENFQQFLAGAHAMDQHFITAPYAENMPVILALLGVWYNNFWHAETQAIICYSELLREFTNYLQQLDMESNGKSVNSNNDFINYATGAILWGGHGTNGQHSFHQLLQQGTHLIPVDFIAVLNTHYAKDNSILFANCLAQSQALLQGKTLKQAYQELIAAGLSQTQAEKLAPHKVMPGNRPSNTILLEKITPYSLGALIALYEHKVFVQGAIWQINSFDQWGVELGKQLANELLDNLKNETDMGKNDSSTDGLMTKYIDNLNFK